MTERMDVVSPRKDPKSEKTYYDRIGAAWPTKNGGWSVRVSAWPVGDTLLLFPPKPREERKEDNGEDVPF
jgi:hypothetical protein